MFRTDVIDHHMPVDLTYVNIFFGNKHIFHNFGMLLGINTARKCIPIKTFVYHIKCSHHSSKFNNFQSCLNNLENISYFLVLDHSLLYYFLRFKNCSLIGRLYHIDLGTIEKRM